MIKFNYNDGGRAAAGFKGNTGDCVTRAIAIVTGKPYREVYDELNVLCKKKRTYEVEISGRTYINYTRSAARTGVHKKIYHPYLIGLGFEWIPTMGIGTGCKVHLKAEELPSGKIICRVSKHLTAVIDGVVNDTWNPAREVHETGYKDGEQYSAIRERCVYGYYRLREVKPKPVKATVRVAR